MRFLSALLALLLLAVTNQAGAWFNGPYGYSPYTGGYWPNAWPNYGRPMGNIAPYNFNSSDWNVRGSMNENGDAHFIIEYHGNIYDQFYGRGYSQPYYNGFPGYSNYGRGWRW